MSDERPGREPQRIGEVIKALLRRKKFYEKGRYRDIARAWGSVVGDAIAERTKVRSFREGRLVVEVSSSVLRHELEAFMKEQLLTALQATDGGRDVAELRFRLGAGSHEDA